MTFAHQRYGDPSLPTVLFIHGFLGRGGDWDDVISSLSDRYHCLALDLPGHGETVVDDVSSYAMPDCARQIAEWTRSLGVDRMSLVGYSMGGRLGLYLALHYPEILSRVVLESASPGLESEKLRTDRHEHDEHLAERLSSEPMDEFLKQWYAQPIFATLSRRPQLIASLVERRRQQDPGGLALSLRHMGTGVQPSLWDKLPGLRVPTGLIVGELDGKFRDIAERMTASSDRLAMKVVAMAGHNVHLEQADEFSRQLASFLEHGTFAD